MKRTLSVFASLSLLSACGSASMEFGGDPSPDLSSSHAADAGGDRDRDGSGGRGVVSQDGSPGPGSTDSGSSGSNSPDLGPKDGSSGMTPAAVGWLHTHGSQIVDSAGQPVRLTGVSWFGMETANFAPHGLWSRSMASMLDQIKSLGYNSIRVPFSTQMLDTGSTPNSIDLNQNPNLKDISPLEILDALVAGARARQLRIILDRHRPDAGAQSALWYTDRYSEARWIDDWKMLARRYQNDPTVVGCDLHNEPHDPATWGDGNQATDWRLAAMRAGDAILSVNPHLLIIVEGIQTAGGSSYWWGGNLKNAGTFPVELSVANQLVYSPHDYPASVFQQTWFSAPDYPANLADVWDVYWGYLAAAKQTPIWVGEFGTRDETTVDKQWLEAITTYLGRNEISFSFWAWNPNSGDTGGILKDDWQSVNLDKQARLQPLLAPSIP